jgi:hypothetical protein
MTLAILGLLTSLGCAETPESETDSEAAAPALNEVTSDSQDPAQPGHLEIQLRFTAAPANVNAVPTIDPVSLPDFPSRNAAIWGATGRDQTGKIWLGVSMENDSDSSAELICYDPQRDIVTRHGDVINNLQAAGLYRTGESQMKIHSRILQADDGYLYFASSDLEGEDEKRGTVDPKWGAHLWRTKPDQDTWEHLAAFKKGVYAISGRGPWVYVLGYFDHHLFQWNMETEKLSDVHVGSLVGHKSRNFFTDERGHAYVPRVRRGDDIDEEVICSVVEVTPNLEKINEVELTHYLNWDRLERHGEALISWCIGIPAFCYLADGDIVFSTVSGHLYRVSPKSDGPADVASLGWLHPSGELKSDDGPAGLFTYDGRHQVMSVVLGPDRSWEWVVFDLDTGRSTASPVKIPEAYGARPLLYGNMKRDDAGNFYLVGRYKEAEYVFRPLLWKLGPAK